jgi:peptidoglycan-associated lipoprotein
MSRSYWVIAGLFLLGCGPDKPAAKGADDMKDQKPVETADAKGDAGLGGFKPLKDPALNVSEDIQRACRLEDPGTSPKFDYDSADLSDAEKNLLGQIAKCLTNGPLKGKSVMLVGRADSRGEQEYNMSLGHNRAQRVRGYLSDQGVAGDHLFETSRGALDATGTDDVGFAKDRRVDVQLRQ